MIETCPSCEGSGWQFCQRCEECCEHDRICPRCHGAGEKPRRAEPWMALTSLTLYRTRAEALAVIEEE